MSGANRVARGRIACAAVAASMLGTAAAQQAPRENPECTAGARVVSGICVAPGAALPGGRSGGLSGQSPIEAPGRAPANTSPPQIKVCQEHEVLQDGECRPARNAAPGSTP